jgi:hypothetical protein
MTFNSQVRFQISKEILMNISKKRKCKTLDEYINKLILEDIDKLKI